MANFVKFMFSSQQAIEFWNEEADNFLSISRPQQSYYHKRIEVIEKLVSRYAPDSPALDVGSAEGDLVLRLCKLGYTAYGTDISAPMISKAIQKAGTVFPEAAARFRLTQGSTPPFIEKFSLLTVIGVLPYVNNHSAYLAYLDCMLNKNGMLIITCTSPFSVYNFFQAIKHLGRFNLNRSWSEQWKNILNTGLRSGGFVDIRTKQQVHSMRGLTRMLTAAGYEICETTSFYNIQWLDHDPLGRTRIAKVFARLLGWTHLAVAKRIY